MNLMKSVDALLERVGLVRVSTIRQQLDFAHSVGKRLDEHRELVQDIEQKTDLLRRQGWTALQLACQDDYLMRLYHLVHGRWPEDVVPSSRIAQHVRPRPAVLGRSSLPERQAGH